MTPEQLDTLLETARATYGRGAFDEAIALQQKIVNTAREIDSAV